MSIRVLLFLTFVGLLLIGCSEGDQPTASDTRAEEQAVEQAQGGEVSQVAGTRSRVEAEAAQPEQAISNPVQQRPDPTESESESTPALADRQQSVQSEPEQQSEPIESQEESEAPPTNLTDVPATVIKDADVRVRPGLPWPVIERLSAGDEVVILNVATGWYRISYGDEREGWIRRTALDLGVVEPHRILHRPAPAIVAEWQGEQYGVMGQSADGAEVRLLPMDDELAEIVSAPIGEVTLLADDITVQDLPILIGDETVVFPGDDFSVGQGRILPKANEWMWLASGELLAHNDESIWRWRPETDEIDFISRPHGWARLSPDGERLAVVTCVEEPTGCERWKDTLIVPLDGSELVSFRAAFRRSQPGLSQELGEIINSASDHIVALAWTPDGQALFGAVALEEQVGAGAEFETGVFQLLWLDGRVTQFSTFPVADAPGCLPLSGLSERGNTSWDLRLDVVVTWVYCTEHEYGPTLLHMNLDGEFERVIERRSRFDYLEQPGIDLVRTTDGADALGESLEIMWSPSGRHALVTSNEQKSLWLFDADESQLRRIETIQGSYPERAVWGCGEAALCWNVSWYEDTRLAVMWHWGSVSSGGFQIEVSNGIPIPMQFWSLGVESTLTFLNWSPNGDFLRVLFMRFPAGVGSDPVRWDGLAASSSYSNIVAIVRADGSPIQMLFSEWSAPRDAWSAEGKWFAISG